MRVGEQSTDPIDLVLGEVPVPAPLTPEDVRLAVRAVVVHAAEEWPNGPLCRNDGASYPCRLHRWGRRVLENHGLNERQIEALIRHGNPFVHVPFPFTYGSPAQSRPGAATPPRSQAPGQPGRPVPAYPTRTQPGRPAAPAMRPAAAQGMRPAAAQGMRPGLRPGVPGRPVVPPATAPRWPRAS
ncbi:hypothetical protein [Micromonospora sp. KC721]|uniref:hypothetical protein n=1 Tax=Micromonospora sp. KC721 TaxID=2530380 RepID=UPI001045B083|nr:hypothetical protein [Micromonospora sp. KC721]TDB81415.1 hypothetical protein E1182_05440 [Micromonospora sp. KC721]